MPRYGEAELQSAFERLTSATIEALGGEDDPFACVQDPNFVPTGMEILGLDKDGAFDWAAGVVPTMIEVLMRTIMETKKPEGETDEYVEFGLDSADINSMAATLLFRGISMGLLLREPNLGNNPELLAKLRSL